MTEENDSGYQIFAVNIKYGREVDTKKMRKERPEMAVLDVPKGIAEIKDKNKFIDRIETFAYDTITRRYGAECTYCQVYLT